MNKNTNNETSIRILYVDGDKDIAQVPAEILRWKGHFEVDLATSAADAKQMLKKRRYDVIVTAYFLKGNTGLEFLKQLKNEGNKIPVAMFSINNEAVAKEALSLGAFKFIEAYGDTNQVFANLIAAIKQKRYT